MNSRLRLIFTAAAGLGGVLIASSLIEEPSRLQLDLSGTHELSAVRAEQRDGDAGAERVAEQQQIREPLPDETVEQAGSLADSVERRESVQEEPTALSAPLERTPIEDAEAREFDLDDLEQEFANESRDPNWSSGMEAQILTELSQMSGLAANLIEVDCRATRCRLRITFPATPLPRQPQLVASTDEGPEFEVAERIGLETEVVLAMREGPGLYVFLTYLRRPEASTVQARRRAGAA